MKTFNKDNYIFFYGGVFSQWYRRDMIIDGITYNCCEQYMMAKKAEVFKDYDRYDMIMEATEPWDQKMHGRLVKNFDYSVWDKCKFDVVLKANKSKFEHEDLKEILIRTKDKIIVEASPTDKIWGIGMGIDSPNLHKTHKWGQNLLGLAIMEVRSELTT